MALMSLAGSIHDAAAQAANRGLHIKGLWSISWPLRAHHFDNQEFEVFRADTNYLIMMDSRIPYEPWYSLSTSDGVDSFFVYHPIELKQLGKLEPRVVQGKVISHGQAHPGVFPTNQTSRVQILWLAYVYPFQTSAATIARDGCLSMPFNAPVKNEWAPYTNFLVSSLEYSPESPAVPKRFKVYHPGHGITKGSTNLYRYEGPYSNRWLFAEFATEKLTNASGMILPLKVVYREYLPKPNGTAVNCDDVQLSLEEVFVVWSAVPCDSEIPFAMPPTTPYSIIGDRRIRRADGGPHSFQVGHNGQLAARSSPDFKRMVDSLRRDERKAAYSRYLFPVVLVGLFLPLLWLAVVRALRKASYNNRGDARQ